MPLIHEPSLQGQEEETPQLATLHSQAVRIHRRQTSHQIQLEIHQCSCLINQLLNQGAILASNRYHNLHPQVIHNQEILDHSQQRRLKDQLFLQLSHYPLNNLYLLQPEILSSNQYQSSQLFLNLYQSHRLHNLFPSR